LELEHHHREHRDLDIIIRIINVAKLSAVVKEKSIAAFIKPAEAETKVHGTTVNKIYFYDVGAVAVIVDRVGTVFGLKCPTSKHGSTPARVKY